MAWCCFVRVLVFIRPLPDSKKKKKKNFNTRYRRTYFDFAKWKSHRASSRYRRHIVGLFGSRIVRALGSPLLFVVVAAVFTGAFFSFSFFSFLFLFFSSFLLFSSPHSLFPPPSPRFSHHQDSTRPRGTLASSPPGSPPSPSARAAPRASLASRSRCCSRRARPTRTAAGSRRPTSWAPSARRRRTS